MNENLHRPKGFGEILDVAFSLCKNRFSQFFLIVLILLGPVFLLQPLILLLTGTSFFREVGSGGNWLEQITDSFQQTANTTLTEDLLTIVAGLPQLALVPVAFAATLYAVDKLNKNQDFVVGGVIKQAFSKFWLILGGSLLFELIMFGMLIATIIGVTFIGIFGIMANPISGVVVMIILFLAAGLGAGYFLARWGFYLGSAVFDDDIPGLSKSWYLTRQNSWKVLGIYVVFTLIFMCINLAVDSILVVLLGNSVLYSIIMQLVTLLTTMIFMVGYAVIYFDLKIRQDGDDLQHMIDDYTGKEG